MIPCEILKKIRQIKRRTNRIVTKTLGGALFHPSAQILGIATGVEDRQHHNALLFNQQLNHK